MSRVRGLTELEEASLRAVRQLDRPNGHQVARALVASGRGAHAGAVYRVLKRLETLGALRASLGEVRAVRGGRAPLRYALTADGQRLLSARERERWALG